VINAYLSKVYPRVHFFFLSRPTSRAEDPGASPAGFMQISAIATMAAVEHPNEHGVSQTH